MVYRPMAMYNPKFIVALEMFQPSVDLRITDKSINPANCVNWTVAFWNKPYPTIDSDKHRLKNAFLAALVVFLCLYLLKPFGLARSGAGISVYIAFGLITGFVALIYQTSMVRIFPSIHQEENWTVGKEILHTGVLILLISFANYVYSIFLGGTSWNFLNLLSFVWSTFLIGIVPIGLGIIIRQNHLLKKHQNEAARLSAGAGIATGINEVELSSLDENDSLQQPEISIYDHQERLQFTCLPLEFYYAKSADNYVECVYRVDGELKRLLVRCTMQKMTDLLSESPRVFRSHRSYLVNLDLVKEVKGNSQGYQLELQGLEETIPVSRGKRDALKALLNV